MHSSYSITDTGSLSTGASVASILAIKGDLRIHRDGHTIKQKPHVILRRVESSENASDDSQNNAVANFRLFAAKQISLKPGKELLLTVASADDRYKGQIVTFSGTLRGPDEDSDHESTTEVEEEPQVIEEEEDEEEMISEAVVPPKMRMRRQWTKRVEEVTQIRFKMPVAHSSVGVQAQPVYASSSVQAISVQNSVSVQTQTSKCEVQTTSLCASSAVQADPPPIASVYTSMDVQTDVSNVSGKLIFALGFPLLTSPLEPCMPLSRLFRMSFDKVMSFEQTRVDSISLPIKMRLPPSSPERLPVPLPRRLPTSSPPATVTSQVVAPLSAVLRHRTSRLEQGGSAVRDSLAFPMQPVPGDKLPAGRPSKRMRSERDEGGSGSARAVLSIAPMTNEPSEEPPNGNPTPSKRKTRRGGKRVKEKAMYRAQAEALRKDAQARPATMPNADASEQNAEAGPSMMAGGDVGETLTAKSDAAGMDLEEG
ncbi:hypothetical protein K438DRAFT_1935354 [Mycena galopus ATCC 62051]|nr:hypothetical protein K438DRAFT_1935354 [Mycena galopus ATCC 62051]